LCTGDDSTGDFDNDGTCDDIDPAQDCADLKSVDSSLVDGIYSIDPQNTGVPFNAFCDMSNDGGGWTLAANIDDINDPYFGGHSTPYYSQDWVDAWESASTRNENLFPTLTSDVSVTTKYRSFSEVTVSDVRIVYKNDGAYMLMEGFDINDSLDNLFALVPGQGTCSVNASSLTETRFPSGATGSPRGLNCSDTNQGWYTDSGSAENARIGGRDADFSLSENAYLGALGDRSFDTSLYEKTWGEFSSGVAADNNIMLFVR